MKKRGQFVFNEPYNGEVIEKINEVVQSKDYVELLPDRINAFWE